MDLVALLTETIRRLLQVAPLLTPTVAVVGVAIGLYQYRKAQRWKRSEFVAGQIKEFEANPLVRRAMFMLDFTQGTFVSEPCVAKRCEVTFTDAFLTAAVAAHSTRTSGLSEAETHVRLAFCDFFEGLDRFHTYVTAKLISSSDLEPYLPYWIHRFTKPDIRSDAFIASVWTFIDAYGYTGVRALATQLQQKEMRLPQAEHRMIVPAMFIPSRVASGAPPAPNAPDDSDSARLGTP